MGYACDASTEGGPASPSPTSTEPPASLSPSPSVTASPAPILTPSPSPSPTLQPTSTPFISDFERFKEFAPQVAVAVVAGYGAFFAERVVEISVTCRGDEQLGSCSGKPAGHVITGIPGVVWFSDAEGLVPLSGFESMLREWFSASLAEESDNFGHGAARLYALGQRESNSEVFAITTGSSMKEVTA